MKEFTKQDMINFIKWYDDKDEDGCHRTFDEEFDEWIKKDSNVVNPLLGDAIQDLIEINLTLRDYLCNNEIKTIEIAKTQIGYAINRLKRSLE